MDEQDLLVILVVSCICASCCFVFWIYVAHHHQMKAFAGDERSAKRIILPFYQPFIKQYAVLYGLIGLSMCLLFSSDRIYYSRVLQYYGFCELCIFFFVPSFLLQTSASRKALGRTGYQLFPWWLSCNIFWGLTFLPIVAIAWIFYICFVIVSVSIPIYVCLGILFRYLYSRVQVGSNSNRNTTELVILYAVVYGCYLILSLALSLSVQGNASNDDRMDDNSSRTLHEQQLILDGLFTGFLFLTNQIFPFALFRTFIADTKFWRGLGKHNQGGINIDEGLRMSGVDVHRPTMELNVISSSFQVMMADVNDITVDFAFLQLEQLIGEGATAKVFRGKLKEKLVAIKLSTPPEITEEVIDVFVAEARIASSLTHRNIVQFQGICVRPPQIGMVFEFCDGGNLKSNLSKQAKHWSRPRSKIQACLDASHGIHCLHQYGYIHRDIKTENFFVGKKWVVKLGDFGEATRVRKEEETKSRRMTILGTVAFMAPELVNAQRHYDQGIDIYALGVTFWEIWTGRDPYEDCSTFEIYDRIKQGVKLEIPDFVPSEIAELMAMMWHEEAERRPSAKKVVEILEKFISSSQQPASSGDREIEEKTPKSPVRNKSNSSDSNSDNNSEERGSRGSERDQRVSIVINPILNQQSTPQSPTEEGGHIIV